MRGGAARAVAVALADSGAQVTVSARRDGVRRARSRISSAAVPSVFPPPPGTWDLLVNATPREQRAPPARARWGARRSTDEMVYDLVYNPAETTLLSDARAAGCDTIGGLEMLVAQAERQFELWTGQRPPEGIFATAARSACQRSRPAAARVSRRIRYEADDVRRVRGAGAARHVRAGRQGDHRRPADAGLGVPQDRRALRLRVPASRASRAASTSAATRSSARIRSSSCARAAARRRSSGPA